MKKLLCFALALCVLLLCCLTAYAGEVKKIEIRYISDDMIFKSEELVLPTETTLVRIAKEIPQRTDYEFLGWRMASGDDTVYSGGQTVKLGASTVFEAVWKYENSCEITYVDEGKEVLPRQIAIDKRAAISEVVLQRPGKTFYGWSTDKSKDVIKPGQECEFAGDTTLNAVWKQGALLEPELVVTSEKDGKVTFAQKNIYSGPMAYDSYSLEIRNLSTKELKTYTITSNSLTIEDLMPGQYQARLCALKYNIEYRTSWTDFVVYSGLVVPENPLRLILDGEELVFDETPPMLLNGFTYIALRHFCESMNAKVDWNDKERSATISLGGDIVKVYENSDRCVVNGTLETLPAKTTLVESRLMLPLRSVAELCRAEIVWDDDRTVYIFSKDSSFFDETMAYIQNKAGEFLGVDQNDLTLKNEPDFGCGWIFDAYDEQSDLYCIHSLADLSQMLLVSDSVMVESQQLVLGTDTVYDGYLWRVVEKSEDEYVISPANSKELFFDGETGRLTSEEKTVTIKHISEY